MMFFFRGKKSVSLYSGVLRDPDIRTRGFIMIFQKRFQPSCNSAQDFQYITGKRLSPCICSDLFNYHIVDRISVNYNKDLLYTVRI